MRAEHLFSWKAFVKILSILLIVVIISNFILIMYRKITPLAFWIITAVVAVAAFKGIPMLNKKRA